MECKIMRKDGELVWMDWAKIIGIFLVVYGHLLQRTDDWHHPELRVIWDVIYLFHMPLFFLLSGYMYKGSHSFKKIFRALVLPYLIYQLLFLPFAFAMNVRAEGFSANFAIKQFAGALMGDGYNTPISFFDCIPCWFIVSMVQLRLLFHFIDISKKYVAIPLAVASVLLLAALHYFHIDLWFCIDSSIMAIPYFIIGYAMAEYGLTSKIRTAGGGYLLSFVCIVILIWVYVVNGPAQMNGPSFGQNIIVNYIGGMAGSLMIVFAVIKINRISTTQKLIARSTLFLIFYHWMVLLLLGLVGFFRLWRIIDNFIWAAIIMALYAVLVLWSSVPVIKLINKKYPVVLGKK